MTEFFKWLSSNPVASTILIVAFGVIVTVFVIAFFQGRDISFWPPKIGERPKREVPQHPNSPQEISPAQAESPIRPQNQQSQIVRLERSYGQFQDDAPAIEQLEVPSFINSLAPNQLRPRSLLLETRHSRIEEVTLLGTRCVVKSTKKHLVDLPGLKMLAGKHISASFQKTSVSIATPVKVWLEDDNVCELHPFFEGITLYDVIQKNKCRIQGSYLGIIFNCTVRVLSEFHSLGLLHRDVNPTNMLLTQTGDIVLLDVSFACREENQNVPVENPAFSAPEQSLGRAERRSDLYSLAATIFFLANGIESASCATEQALQKHILNINFGAFGRRSKTLPGSGGGAWELIYDLLNTDVAKRPSRNHDLLLDPGTFPRGTSLYGVLDLGQLGFLLVFPSGIFIGPKTTALKELRELVDKNTIDEPELLEDVRVFLSGKNPWLAA